MKQIKYEAGMLFCTNNPSAVLGRMINAVQKFHSPDNESTYTHAGIIISDQGHTFESLWKIRRNHIREYAGSKLIIGRHVKMNLTLFSKGWVVVRQHDGQMYPFWRLPLHLYRPLAKYISTGNFPVCSELACKFMVSCGLMDYWKGRNPDDVADMIRKWKDYEIIYERT